MFPLVQSQVSKAVSELLARIVSGLLCQPQLRVQDYLELPKCHEHYDKTNDSGEEGTKKNLDEHYTL